LRGAVEEFAQEFAAVIKRFQKLKSWKDSERIAVGGGFRDSRAGELAIGRAAVLLKATHCTRAAFLCAERETQHLLAATNRFQDQSSCERRW
jgi:hypothetical protein